MLFYLLPDNHNKQLSFVEGENQQKSVALFFDKVIGWLCIVQNGIEFHTISILELYTSNVL